MPWLYLYDGHGSVRTLTNEAGRVTDRYSYDAYGNLLEKEGDTKNEFLYTGEQYNANTGLYYLRARYMNPSTGTFISMDSYQGSIYDPVTLHKYLYANANPVMYTDPSGYMAFAVKMTVRSEMSVAEVAYNATMITIGMTLIKLLKDTLAIHNATTRFTEAVSSIIEGGKIFDNPDKAVEEVIIFTTMQPKTI